MNDEYRKGFLAGAAAARQELQAEVDSMKEMRQRHVAEHRAEVKQIMDELARITRLIWDDEQRDDVKGRLQ
jgi:hypothetical protein